MSNLRSTLTIALVTLAATVPAGCGSDDAATDRPAAAKPASQQSDMPIEQYVSEMDALRQTVDDARSDYFHAGHGAAEARKHAGAVKSAYGTAAEQLDALATPAEAADVHGRILALWRKRSEQVADILAAKPFKKARFSDLMYKTDRDGALYEEAFRLY
jgi:outer membrane murein-binding lipoprotein Lpp